MDGDNIVKTWIHDSKYSINEECCLMLQRIMRVLVIVETVH